MGFIYVVAGIIAGFVVLMLGMRFFIQFKSSAMKGRSAPELAGKPGKILKRHPAALFYFYSPSCGACASMTPAVKKLALQTENVVAVDISKDMDTARKFGVMATPTLVVVREGIIKEILIGPQSPAVIEAQLG
ncbi:MAG: thioredoxin family protein [Deltaproteobacteria bacterium]|nr:thioredoxin family protein [Deltaproteobacteria bacterium]